LISRLARRVAAGDDAREAGGGERATALTGENERRLGGLLALKPAQGPQFVA
jgi:hypothetical protein